MKPIHPQYFKDIQVTCLCGATYTMNAAFAWPIKVENCPACHPVYNKWAVIIKEAKWMRQKFDDRMAKFKQISWK